MKKRETSGKTEGIYFFLLFRRTYPPFPQLSALRSKRRWGTLDLSFPQASGYWCHRFNVSVSHWRFSQRSALNHTACARVIIETLRLSGPRALPRVQVTSLQPRAMGSSPRCLTKGSKFSVLPDARGQEALPTERRLASRWPAMSRSGLIRDPATLEIAESVQNLAQRGLKFSLPVPGCWGVYRFSKQATCF